MYKAVEIHHYSIIVKCGVKCTDRDIQTKNEFTHLDEAQKYCNYLNELGASNE